MNVVVGIKRHVFDILNKVLLLLARGVDCWGLAGNLLWAADGVSDTGEEGSEDTEGELYVELVNQLNALSVPSLWC